jgi:hypothetical protein
MAVLALDDLVRIQDPAFEHVSMAGFAGLLPLVLDSDLLPVLNGSCSIQPVGESVFVYAEVLRHIEVPKDKEKNDEADDDEQRSPDVALHVSDLHAHPRRSGSCEQRRGCRGRAEQAGIERAPEDVLAPAPAIELVAVLVEVGLQVRGADPAEDLQGPALELESTMCDQGSHRSTSALVGSLQERIVPAVRELWQWQPAHS